jgi:phosphocarrier protein HPr
MVAEQQFAIVNKLGLHARAASRFVLTASRFSAEIEVEKDGRRANGRSFIGLLILFAARGDLITIRGKGTDAVDALKALGALINSGFGEIDGSSTRCAEDEAAPRIIE